MFQHPILSNVVTDLGVLLTLFIVAFLVYVPGVQTVFQTVNVPAEYFGFPVLSGFLLFLLNESRKWGIRRNPFNPVVKALTW
jgi:hypothetical protein